MKKLWILLFILIFGGVLESVFADVSSYWAAVMMWDSMRPRREPKWNAGTETIYVTYSGTNEKATFTRVAPQFIDRIQGLPSCSLHVGNDHSLYFTIPTGCEVVYINGVAYTREVYHLDYRYTKENEEEIRSILSIFVDIFYIVIVIPLAILFLSALFKRR